MKDYEPRRPTAAVEDYTSAFLWMAGLILFMSLFTLWAIFGYLASLATALFVRAGIEFLPRRE